MIWVNYHEIIMFLAGGSTIYSTPMYPQPSGLGDHLPQPSGLKVKMIETAS